MLQHLPPEVACVKPLSALFPDAPLIAGIAAHLYECLQSERAGRLQNRQRPGRGMLMYRGLPARCVAARHRPQFPDPKHP